MLKIKQNMQNYHIKTPDNYSSRLTKVNVSQVYQNDKCQMCQV
jgi:hypothetical protein